MADRGMMVPEEEEMGTWTVPVRGLEDKARGDVGWLAQGLGPTPRVAPGGSWEKVCALGHLNKGVGKANRDRGVLGWGGGQSSAYRYHGGARSVGARGVRQQRVERERSWLVLPVAEGNPV